MVAKPNNIAPSRQISKPTKYAKDLPMCLTFPEPEENPFKHRNWRDVPTYTFGELPPNFTDYYLYVIPFLHSIQEASDAGVDYTVSPVKYVLGGRRSSLGSYPSTTSSFQNDQEAKDEGGGNNEDEALTCYSAALSIPDLAQSQPLLSSRGEVIRNVRPSSKDLPDIITEPLLLRSMTNARRSCIRGLEQSRTFEHDMSERIHHTLCEIHHLASNIQVLTENLRDLQCSFELLTAKFDIKPADKVQMQQVTNR